MLVKCQCCGTKIDRNTAYKVNIGKQNKYYCSEHEYIQMITAKAQIRQTENEILQLINYIFGYEIKNTVLFNELREIKNAFTLDVLYHYMYDSYKDIEYWMSKKEFKNEYNKIRYFTAILKNNLADYKPPKEEPIKETNDDIFEVKYKPKARRKCLADYKDEE